MCVYISGCHPKYLITDPNCGNGSSSPRRTLKARFPGISTAISSTCASTGVMVQSPGTTSATSKIKGR